MEEKVLKNEQHGKKSKEIKENQILPSMKLLHVGHLSEMIKSTYWVDK